MKQFFMFILMICSVNVYSQTVTDHSPFIAEFVPQSTTISVFSNHLPQQFNFSPSIKSALFLTGSILQGLKFNNALDDFASLAPFDFRALEPVSVTEFDLMMHKYQLFSIEPY